MGMEHIEFALKLEEAYAIKVSDAEIVQLRTVGDAFDLVARKLNATNKPFDKDQLWNEICRLVVETGNFVGEYKGRVLSRSVRLIDDLGWG